LKCKICDKETESEFCSFHQKAYENLIKNYEEWKKALEISWKDYLNEIIKNPYSGKWVKEVAEYLTKHGGKMPRQEK